MNVSIWRRRSRPFGLLTVLAGLIAAATVWVALSGAGQPAAAAPLFAPPPTSGLSATHVGDRIVSLIWTNPTDNEFDGTRIMRKEGSAPEDVNDGMEVYDGPGDTATDNTVPHDGTWYYAAYAHDAAPDYAAPAIAGVTIDTTPPVISVPADIIREATSPAGAVVTFPVSATDAMDPNPSVTAIPASGSVFPLGTTTVTLRAVDNAGNESSRTFTVTIQDTTGPGNVTGFTASATGGTVMLSWTDPAADFTGTRIVRKRDSAPGGPSDGTIVYDGAGGSATDALGDGTWYYAAYAHDAVPNYAGGVVRSVTIDTAAPGNVTGFTVSVGRDRLSLAWTNPSDADLTGVKVLRKAGGAPGGPDDASAIVVYEGLGESFTDSGVVSGTTYHYAVFAHDLAGNFSDPARGSGALDTTAPADVTLFTADAGPGHVALTWINPNDDDFAETRIIRKVEAAPTGPNDGVEVYAGSGTAHQDEDVKNGTRYFYAAYTYDHLGNVSTGATVEATPARGDTELSLHSFLKIVGWRKDCGFTARLSVAGAGRVPGEPTVVLEESLDGTNWTAVGEPIAPEPGSSDYTGRLGPPIQKTYYRLFYPGSGEDYASTHSDPVQLTPRVALRTPVAPRSVRRKAGFRVYGGLKPRQRAGSKTVTVYCYRKTAGKWVLKKKVVAKNSSHGAGSSRYAAWMSLPSAGSWKLSALSPATAKYARTWSVGNRIVKVK